MMHKKLIVANSTDVAIHYAAEYDSQFTYVFIAVQTNTFYGSWWVLSNCSSHI